MWRSISRPSCRRWRVPGDKKNGRRGEGRLATEEHLLAAGGGERSLGLTIRGAVRVIRPSIPQALMTPAMKHEDQGRHDASWLTRCPSTFSMLTAENGGPASFRWPTAASSREILGSDRCPPFSYRGRCATWQRCGSSTRRMPRRHAASNEGSERLQHRRPV
jgi:hypothetical protein